MVYVALISVSLAGMAIYDGRSERRSGLILYGVLCLMTALVAGLRFRLGMDTVFDEVMLREDAFSSESKLMQLNSRFSPVYLVIVRIVRMFSQSMWPVQTVISLWTGVSVFLFGYLNRREIGGRLFLYALLYLLLLYIPLNFESSRQGMAIGFFLFAWYNLRRGRYRVFIALCICASLCHRFAIVTLLFAICEAPWYVRMVSGRVSMAIAVAVATVTGFAVRYFIVDVLPGIVADYPYLSLFADSYSDYLQTINLNWRGVAGVVIVTIIYPVLAELLLRRVNVAVQTAVLVVCVGIGLNLMLRVYFFLGLICLLEVVRCVAFRRSMMTVYMWVLSFLPLVFVSIYRYSGRQVWADGSLHRDYEYYWPYTSVLNPERDICRELTCAGKFHYDNYHVVFLLGSSPDTGERLSDEEEYWIGVMKEKHPSAGEDEDAVEYYIREAMIVR
ncbi:MAG: EpsG family protein [Muribaculaceae bacterium]|nr:EpsG family protein [Muribaculaceae bacterium]